MQDNEVKDKATAEQATEQAQAAEEAEEVKSAEEAPEPEEEKPEAAEPEADPKDAQIEELQRRLLRLQADFENFRRRTAKEKEELSTFVTAGVVGKFLKILDNFERAEASSAKGDNVEAVLEGMQKIRRQFEDTFKELKVTEIAAQDARFDPNLHEAVMRGQNPDLEDETIDMVFEKGYKLGDKVIRHSKVRVINND